MTHFADHAQGFSHDAVNRLLRRDKLTGQIIWEHVKGDIVASPRGCLVFDDSILDKRHSHHIDLVRLQYSGNAHGLIKGIGMVNCLYVNPETVQYWVVDYRLFDPDGDGKTKLDHVQEMLVAAIASKALALSHVLFDTWYATKDLMLFVESLGKRYCCPPKSNRQVDDSGGERAYRRVDGLDQQSTQGVQDACALRWKIKQFHRELKQLTGFEKFQCRKAQIQRNHIVCAVLVWIRLTALARKACATVYKLKHDMLSDYLPQKLRSPSVRMVFA